MKPWLRHIAMILIFPLGYMLLSGLPNPPSDFGILSQKPCGPPCYSGIRPGVTTFDEARLVLEKIGERCWGGDHTTSDGYRTRVRGCFSGHYADMSVAAFGGETVDDISLIPPVEITVGQFIGEYGPPDRVTATIVTLLSDDPPVSSMDLFYDRLQTSMRLSFQPGRTYAVAASTPILDFSYTTTAAYQHAQMLLASLRNSSQPWKGYGTYTPKVGP